jgi:hypothetical protein
VGSGRGHDVLKAGAAAAPSVRPRVANARFHRALDALLFLFLLVWFGCGVVWALEELPGMPFRQQLLRPKYWCHKHIVYFTVFHITHAMLLISAAAIAAIALFMFYCLKRIYYC